MILEENACTLKLAYLQILRGRVRMLDGRLQEAIECFLESASMLRSSGQRESLNLANCFWFLSISRNLSKQEFVHDLRTSLEMYKVYIATMQKPKVKTCRH
mmetsp:Transcript_18668/g.61300  ORF Transcript_18668/g.61300 Transcript_18668/m.61300 type:complete len:101 (-) Transcript_18668:276-578(-)